MRKTQAGAWPSLRDRNPFGHLDTFAADPAAIGDGLDPHGSRRVEGRAVGRVDVARELEARRADPIWIRNSITARAPAAAMSPSSARRFAPPLVTASGD